MVTICHPPQICEKPSFQLDRRDKDVVNAKIKKLKRVERTLIRLRYWEGLSTWEISIRLSKDWAEVMAKLRSAHAKLREMLLTCPEFESYAFHEPKSRREQNDAA